MCVTLELGKQYTSEVVYPLAHHPSHTSTNSIKNTSEINKKEKNATLGMCITRLRLCHPFYLNNFNELPKDAREIQLIKSTHNFLLSNCRYYT